MTTDANEVLEYHEEHSLSPGHRLRIARERLQLDIEDIAQKMRLKPSIIEIIENDDYEHIQRNPVFIRGYLRGYAKLVGVSGDEVVNIFNKIYEEEPLVQPALKGHKHAVRASDKPIRWITFVICSGLLILVALWWQSQKTNYAKVPVKNEDAQIVKQEKGIPHAIEHMSESKKPDEQNNSADNKPSVIHKYSSDLDFN